MNTVLIGVLLFLGNALFVAAEYGLFGVRRTRVQALASQGSGPARLLLRALDDRNRYVAGIQIGITLFGIAIGAVIEPALSDLLDESLGFLPKGVISAISIMIVAYPLVVLGELVPKYLTLQYSERVALALILPLRIWVLAISPVIWLFDMSGALVLRLMRIDAAKMESASLDRKELAILVEQGEEAGALEETHADMVLKTLHLDRLDAEAVMIHRLDMECLSLDMKTEQVADRLSKIRHSRLPVYGDDLDDIRGIAYLQDLIGALRMPEFRLEDIIKPAEFIPESLTLDRALRIMREKRIQILIVSDEHGGTSGLLTLEDIVEEILGDLQDRPETGRPDIEQVSPTRLRLNPRLRWDELLEHLGEEVTEDTETDTLATMVVERIGRVPRQGDSVSTAVGRLVVEQMTRQRIIQLGLVLEAPYEIVKGK